MGKLTATAVKNAKPTDSQFKLTDGAGLYLLVTPKGAKYWRYDYRFAGKRKTLALGVYPEVSLLQAREAHIEARKKLKDSVDPSRDRKVEKLSGDLVNATTFKLIAEEWFQRHMEEKSEGHRGRTRRILDNDLYPWLATTPIDHIKPVELLSVLRRIEQRSVDLAHRAKQTCGLVFKYAVITGRCEYDPSQSLTGALKSVKTRHRAAITDQKQLGALLRSIDGFRGSPVVSAALQLTPLLFQRPGELRQMEWNEVNWEQSRWELPAEKMKMRLPHIVPLPTQAINILKGLYPITGRGRYVFPSARGGSRCLSDNGVRSALRTLGFTNEEVVPHGFRATARTLLDEQLRFRIELIEMQMAHAVKDVNGRAYNRTTYLEERVIMMQEWADYLDSLRYASKGS